MEHVDCTAVLVECGFLSNPQEAERLKQGDYQRKLTAAICGALIVYLGEEGSTNEV